MASLASSSRSFNGTTSDFAQLFHQLYLDDHQDLSVPPVRLPLQWMPQDLQERLHPLVLTFDALPPLLQQAVLWDTGYVWNARKSTLAPIYTKCGTTMAELLLPPVRLQCPIQRCESTQFAETSTCPFLQTPACAVVMDPTTVALPSSSVVLWSSGHNGQSTLPVLYVEWISSTLGLIQSSRQSETPICSIKNAWTITIPCSMYYSNPIDGSWCRPQHGLLVANWLKDHATKIRKEEASSQSVSNATTAFNPLYLIPIIIGGLLILAIVVWMLYRSFCRHSSRPRRHTARRSHHDTPRQRQELLLSPLGDHPHPRFSQPAVRPSHKHRTPNVPIVPSPQTVPPQRHANAQINVERMLRSDPVLRSRRIRYKQLHFISRLVQTSRSEVWLCELASKNVVTKRLIPSDRIRYEEVEEFVQEIQLTASLQHPNIVECYGVAWETMVDVCLVMEYMPKGDLQTHLMRDGDVMTWHTTKLSIAIDVAHALAYLHSRHPLVLHRDLQSKNVLLTQQLCAKLIDFGVSRRQTHDEELMTAGVGTPYWTAPEILEGTKYTSSSDVYSFGVVLSELDTTQLPYFNVRGNDGALLRPFQILKQVVQGTLQPTLMNTCPKPVATIAKACLSRDPARRPSAAVVLQTLRSFQTNGFEASRTAFDPGLSTMYSSAVPSEYSL